MLEYEIHGKENSRTILFLHGALVSKTMWIEQIELLQKDFQVLTLNLPEHGKSSLIIGNYTIENIAKEVHKLTNELGLKKMILCGHSLGGIVAQYFAYAYPHKVDKLILADTAYGTKNNLWEKILSAISVVVLKTISKKRLISLSAQNYGKKSLKVKNYVTKEMNNYSKETMYRVMSAALNYSGKEYLKHIKSSTLIVVAEDNKQTHRQGKVMNRLIPHSELVILPNSNHLLNIENPVEFNRNILNFIGSLTTRRLTK